MWTDFKCVNSFLALYKMMRTKNSYHIFYYSKKYFAQPVSMLLVWDVIMAGFCKVQSRKFYLGYDLYTFSIKSMDILILYKLRACCFFFVNLCSCEVSLFCRICGVANKKKCIRNELRPTGHYFCVNKLIIIV